MLTVEQLRQKNPGLDIFGYESTETTEQAAALILYYFESERERQSFLNQPVLIRNQDHSSYALHNSGRTIGEVAGLFQYKPDLAWAGFDMIMKSIEDPKALTLEDASYLLAVATPMHEGLETPAMAKVFLEYAETIMDSGTLAPLDPIEVDMRSVPLNVMYVQAACGWLSRYLADPGVVKDENHARRTVQLAQRFLKYCPSDENSALRVLDRNADDVQVRMAAPDIQKAWLNNVVRKAGYAFPDGKLNPEWKSSLQKYGNPNNEAEFIAAVLKTESWLRKRHPRIYPGGDLVPAVEYKPQGVA